jgi:hypothetical protein
MKPDFKRPKSRLQSVQQSQADHPQHPKLIEQAKKGRLKVTISSVALEAGVSRTLIGFDGCRYMEVRKKILGVNEAIPVRAPTDMRTINANLREVNKVLEQRFKMVLSENAALLIRMGRLEREFEDKAEEIQRINNRGKRNQNEIVGLHIVKPASIGESEA